MYIIFAKCHHLFQKPKKNLNKIESAYKYLNYEHKIKKIFAEKTWCL
jgi:hypothetical protein